MRTLEAKAIVQKLVLEGKHGPFAIATSDQIEGSVTFSLEPTVWKEKELPEEGSIVLLEDIVKKRAGWRAKKGRSWRLSDEQEEQREMSSRKRQFLYPVSRQFPFDEICDQIVRELEKRNWQVPGIDVNFNEYGSGEQKFRMVSCIKSQDFKLWFCRVQRTIAGGKWNDIAGITQIVIPGKEINVHDDESGPTLYLYVGSDYERDRKKFMHGAKVNSKLRGEPRIYLQYQGGCRCQDAANKMPVRTHTHPGQRSPLLLHTNDLDREYDPKGSEPKLFYTKEVMEEFKRYLEETVLRMVLSTPLPEKEIDIFAEKDIPFPESIGPIFCFGGWRDAIRIKQGKKDPEKLSLSNRFGLLGSGNRLMPLGTPNDGTVPDIAYEGFLWCGIGEVTAETSIESLLIPHNSGIDERIVIRIKPNRGNNIYIADHAPYERRREELYEATRGIRNTFTDEEIADFVRARGRTIVPISEYQGEYEQPVILIGRELSFDEVEIVNDAQ